MRVVPEEMADRVLAIFPVDDVRISNRVIADQVERGSLALPDLIRISARPEITADDILALVNATEDYEIKYAFILKDALKAKALAIKADQAWGLNGFTLQEALRLADEIETALKAQPLVAAA